MGKKVQNKTMIKKFKEKKAKKDRIKNSKKFKDMKRAEKDKLLEAILTDLGYL